MCRQYLDRKEIASSLWKLLQTKKVKNEILTGNGLGASSATLSEQFSETFSAIGFLILGSEPLAGQRLVAVSARKAFTMPGIVLVSHTASRDDLYMTATKY